MKLDLEIRFFCWPPNLLQLCAFMLRAHNCLKALGNEDRAVSQALSCLPPTAARAGSFPELELILDG